MSIRTPVKISNLPQGNTDLFIDGYFNRIYEIQGCYVDKNNRVNIITGSKPKFKVQPKHLFHIKMYKNETTLREFLSREIKFTGTIDSIHQYHDSTWEIIVYDAVEIIVYWEE